jgi:hypothetical protein
MKFRTPWKIYDESEMDFHELGDPDGRSVFVAKDRTCVWIRWTEPSGQWRFRIADVDQITDLWRQHRIMSLLSVVRSIDSSTLPADCFQPEIMEEKHVQEQLRRLHFLS